MLSVVFAHVIICVVMVWPDIHICFCLPALLGVPSLLSLTRVQVLQLAKPKTELNDGLVRRDSLAGKGSARDHYNST